MQAYSDQYNQHPDSNIPPRLPKDTFPYPIQDQAMVAETAKYPNSDISNGELRPKEAKGQDALIQQLEDKLAEKDDDTEKLGELLDEKVMEMAEKNHIIEEREKEIGQLKAKLAAKERRQAAFDAGLKIIMEQLGILQKEVEKIDIEINGGGKEIIDLERDGEDADSP